MWDLFWIIWRFNSGFFLKDWRITHTCLAADNKGKKWFYIVERSFCLCCCCCLHRANKHLLPMLAVVPNPGATVQTAEAADCLHKVWARDLELDRLKAKERDQTDVHRDSKTLQFSASPWNIGKQHVMVRIIFSPFFHQIKLCVTQLIIFPPLPWSIGKKIVKY